MPLPIAIGLLLFIGIIAVILAILMPVFAVLESILKLGGLVVLGLIVLSWISGKKRIG